MRTDDTLRVMQLINHDTQFALCQNSGINPIVINRFDMPNSKAMERVQELIFTDAARSTFIAKCECERLEGNQKIGMTCPICLTKVAHLDLLDQNNLICKNWLSSPTELPNGWLSPKVYMMLAGWLSYTESKDKKNYLDDILDVDSVLPHDLEGIVEGRGFKYLYDNFDRIMNFFIFDHPVISKKPDTIAVKYCLTLYRDRVFCHYVPILNAAINPIISSEGSGPNKRKYSDLTAEYILKAMISLSQLEFAPKRKKDRDLTVERTTFKAYKEIIAYYREATSKYLSVKKAIPRMHLFGSRFHWSIRAVIVPIIGPHRFDELHVPWKLAVNTLRVHIMGALLREYKLSINEVVAKFRRSLQMVDPDIKQIMERMIEESPFPGLPFLWDRPPSIRDGSVMLKFVTKIKTDLNDSCVGITPIDVALPNADFDGDNLAGILILETEMAKKFRKLSPASLIYDRNTGKISSEIAVHKTSSIPINSWLQNV